MIETNVRSLIYCVFKLNNIKRSQHEEKYDLLL